LYHHSPDTKDVNDWIENDGGTKKKLLELVAAVPRFDPKVEPPRAATGPSDDPPLPAVPLLRGGKLIRKLELFFQRRVILPSGIALVIALWVVGTHLYESFDVFPYLCITSPAKRCGKTLLAELIGLASARTKSTANISEAALFRTIQAFRPTMIIDEAETLANRKSERAQFLLSLLNAGHRKGVSIIRCVGKDHTPTEFSVFCPKVLSAIGNLPDTFRDRSLIVTMRRRRKEEPVLRHRYREVSEKGRRRAALAEVWAAKHKAQVEAKYLNQPLEFLEDREADNWAPLFAIAAVAVPNRLEELQQTATRLGRAKNALDVDESYAIRLLSDIRRILRSEDSLRITTQQLLFKLKGIEEGPWSDLTPMRLARMLRPFHVSSRQIWMGENGNARGYDREDLQPVFDSYLSS
jgi:hypothetical protein